MFHLGHVPEDRPYRRVGYVVPLRDRHRYAVISLRRCRYRRCRSAAVRSFLFRSWLNQTDSSSTPGCERRGQCGQPRGAIRNHARLVRSHIGKFSATWDSQELLNCWNAVLGFCSVAPWSECWALSFTWPNHAALGRPRPRTSCFCSAAASCSSSHLASDSCAYMLRRPICTGRGPLPARLHRRS